MGKLSNELRKWTRAISGPNDAIKAIFEAAIKLEEFEAIETKKRVSDSTLHAMVANAERQVLEAEEKVKRSEAEAEAKVMAAESRVSSYAKDLARKVKEAGRAREKIARLREALSEKQVQEQKLTRLREDYRALEEKSEAFRERAIKNCPVCSGTGKIVSASLSARGPRDEPTERRCPECLDLREGEGNKNL